MMPTMIGRFAELRPCHARPPAPRPMRPPSLASDNKHTVTVVVHDRLPPEDWAVDDQQGSARGLGQPLVRNSGERRPARRSAMPTGCIYVPSQPHMVEVHGAALGGLRDW